MDTKVFYAGIMAIAIGAAMWQLGGFADLFSASSAGEDLESGSKIEDEANGSAIDGKFQGDASSTDGNLVGMIISGGAEIFSIAAFVLYLPGEIAELGLPEYAAQPVGSLAAIMISIGVIQFVTNRSWD